MNIRDEGQHEAITPDTIGSDSGSSHSRIAGSVRRQRSCEDDDPRPRRLTQSDYEAGLARTSEEDRSSYDEWWNEWVEQREEEIEDWRDRQILRCAAAAESSNLPILTVKEAATVARISTKRLCNVISDLKRQTGKPPVFVVDGGGTLTQRIDRESFLDWIRGRRPYRRRQDGISMGGNDIRKGGHAHGGFER